MPVYVALIRGINVGKHRRLAMADLRALLTESGYENVSTHIASGNVIFATPERSAASVESALEGALHERFGFAVDVMVRTEAQLAKIIDANPLVAGAPDPAKLHVAFLKEKPSKAEAGALAELRFERDEFALRGTEIYLHLPDGLGTSKTPGLILGRAVKVPATVRTWKVVGKLRELAAAL
ncbi:MAG: hypothetical protein JWN32_300 [Solirubrobacterales bacterium]|nr:hypothetical protein [Solirubrobacterales bacterium]